MLSFGTTGSKVAISGGRTRPVMLAYRGFHDIDRALNHALVITHTIVDILICQMAVDLRADLTLFELHFVLGERASFVAENELNLAELLDQVRVATQGEVHVLRVREKHLHVVIDHLGLDELEHFDDDVEADGDHVAVGNLIGEKLGDPAHRIQVALDVQINVVVAVLLHPEEGQGRPQANDQELEGENRVQQFVHQAHQIGNLRRWLLLVHHDLGLVSDVDADTVAIRSVL
mmetsp:Transcript_30197/g.40147  ORF Transcript_30197/g.40147 Transcript_30197/m.40147 type:complete len:232 (-) Transcript_30197:770-1465(-)